MLLATLATAVTLAGTAFCETLYVAAKSAQLRSGKTSLDPVVANLKLGETVEVVKREERWLQVKTGNGVTGWIYDGKVSASKPASGDSELASLGKSMRGTDASAVTASAGARGLDKASDTYANRSGISQQQRAAVDRMTAYKISDEEVLEFLKSGKLGEYAE
jgi:uncharacterized protein YgiM (DUF1202 family)